MRPQSGPPDRGRGNRRRDGPGRKRRGPGDEDQGDEDQGGDGQGERDATDEEFDAWRALQRATDEKRANIIADVVGHPKGMPSVEELDYTNPALSDDSIRRHLKTLEGVGVVRERDFEPGERLRDFPYKFYELTPAARELFDRNGLFPEAAWQRQYRSVEKTARIREVEEMPRPDP